MLDTDCGGFTRLPGGKTIEDNETFGTISCSRDSTQGLI